MHVNNFVQHGPSWQLNYLYLVTFKVAKILRYRTSKGFPADLIPNYHYNDGKQLIYDIRYHVVIMVSKWKMMKRHIWCIWNMMKHNELWWNMTNYDEIWWNMISSLCHTTKWISIVAARQRFDTIVGQAVGQHRLPVFLFKILDV